MRLGVFGGTFDPIHMGHVRVAERLSERFALDRLLWAPSESPPHKTGKTLTDPIHRYAMAALATAGRADWVASTIDIEGDPPHYSVDTVARLHARYPESRPLFFVMGADSFADLHLWREYLRLVDSCNIIVTARPGHRLDAPQLPESVRGRIIDLRDIPPSDTPPMLEGGGLRIFLTSDALVDISSTDVRAAARRGESLSGIVPEAVADYIVKQELYRLNPNE